MNTHSFKWPVLVTLVVLFLSYSAWIYFHPVQTIPDMSAVADRGKKIWQSKNCQACHQIYGLGGYLGPDLTNVYSRRNEDIIKAFVLSGTKTMPSFNLKEQEMEELLAYLRHLNSSGHADPKLLRATFYGDIEH